MSITNRPPIRSPTLTSSTSIPSPTTVTSPLSTTTSTTNPHHRRRTSASIPEPFPTFDSDTSHTSQRTGSTVPSSLRIPRSTLLSSSIHDQPQQASPQSRSAPNNNPRSPKLPLNARKRQDSIPLKSESSRTDALWASMQATLADVERSATQGTHFFGAAHSAALEDLRAAQVELAKAWARGEDGNNAEEDSNDDRRRESRESDRDSDRSPGTSVKGADTGKRRGTGTGGDEDGDGGDADLEAARRRREANDRYFWRIQQGVLDVVERLDGVARAMGRVEKESREVWDGSSSEDLEDSEA